jgi:hypothetical protein
MDTKHLKAYAPKARRQFIGAVKKRAAQLGIYADNITDVKMEGGAAIIEGRVFSRKQGEQRSRLVSRIQSRGAKTYSEQYDLFVLEMAYTWFNRLASIRYMEIHEYLDHGFRVLSHPINPDSLPEILGHASDVADFLELDKSHIIELQLASDTEEELYRELLLGQCHHLYKIMPFMFEALDDATELLLPDNLTKTDSILKDLVNDIPEEDWSQIEVIGWLYQFYISEHKDAVIGKVVKSEDIPAATQLFTPNWIVKYMVQNSLGAQWLASYSDSPLKAQMEYYIEPAEQTDEVNTQLKAITPESLNPEELTLIDPASGSGHILVEAYDLFKAIYLERGYRQRDIAQLILEKNLFGLDIDQRAAQLTGFALMMKGRADDRRLFERGVKLNVMALVDSAGFDVDNLTQGLELVDYGLNQGELTELKRLFEHATTFGSLIQVPQGLAFSLSALKQLSEASSQDLFVSDALKRLGPLVQQAQLLAMQYNAVVANPPYMGSKGMNGLVKSFAKEHFPIAKSDLFSCFIERGFSLAKDNGYNTMVTMQSWMFLSSFECMRNRILSERTIRSMTQIGYNSFPSLNSKVAQATVFSLANFRNGNYAGTFVDLNSAPQSADKREEFLSRDPQNQYIIAADEFKKIPGSPIAYWIDDNLRGVFNKAGSLRAFSTPRQGLASGDNEKFLRRWYEVDISKTGFNIESRAKAKVSGLKWFPHNKGGGNRKWYGYQEFVIDWWNDGTNITADKQNKLALGLIEKKNSECWNQEYYFQEGVTWSRTAHGKFGVRFQPTGSLFDTAAPTIYAVNDDLLYLLAFLNSSLARLCSGILNPSLSFQVGDLNRLPVLKPATVNFNNQNVKQILALSKADWDATEFSWDFKPSNLDLGSEKLIRISSINWLEKRKERLEKINRLEVENNEFFLNAYGLKHEHRSSSPFFNNTEKNSYELDLVSCSIGFVMGRYSLDREGLVYANSCNDGFKELVADGAYQTFPADDDGIIPLALEYWFFDDDATTCFRKFVETVWGGENLNENLAFVAQSLCLHAIKPKKGEGAMDTIRRYFSSQFFKDHCKTYKKRPIYWLFSSGKEKAFECLVYLHRYNEGTLSRMRTEYVTPLMGKYDHQHSSLEQDILEGSTEQKRLAEKALKDLEKKQAELRTFDEQLKHYAEMRITLDLDDGVKVNYGKFGNLLADVKNIHGVAVK